MAGSPDSARPVCKRAHDSSRQWFDKGTNRSLFWVDFVEEVGEQFEVNQPVIRRTPIASR
jgi:hypothetical protein